MSCIVKTSERIFRVSIGLDKASSSLYSLAVTGERHIGGGIIMSCSGPFGEADDSISIFEWLVELFSILAIYPLAKISRDIIVLL